MVPWCSSGDKKIPSVIISQGKLRGCIATSENGKKIYEFLSIPYAKPPIGNLRFKSPQPPETWEGERDATKSYLENISCQKNFMNGQIIGSEDCLYLNVYTPKLTSSKSELLPVMVYIHGGGFTAGNGILKEESNPEFLVENDIVVVAINYRLGVFGFLSLDIPEVSGNMGLKDQVKALEWVQNNIAKFGGDKRNVTIFGISAGSASVEYLMLSPMARGLFHKTILQSGSALNSWAINFDYDKLALKLADKLAYTGDKSNSQALNEFLLKNPATELFAASIFVTENLQTEALIFGFVPTVEKIQDGAFLTSNPYKLLKEGNFAKVPVVRGFCNVEGALVTTLKPLSVNELISHKNFFNFWSYPLEEDDIKTYNNKFKIAYLEAAKPEDAAHFFGDLLFASGVWLASNFFSKHGLPEYVYKFSYNGNMNISSNLFGIIIEGAGHGDDTGYIFKSNLITKQPKEADILFRADVTKMWSNFAKTGNPTPNGSHTIKWPKYTEQSKAYINLGNKITNEANYEPDRMAIFEEIYEKYHK